LTGAGRRRFRVILYFGLASNLRLEGIDFSGAAPFTIFVKGAGSSWLEQPR
jgi:hypothetical protein